MKKELNEIYIPDIDIQESQNEFDLKEMAQWYGSWGELRKVIDKLEANELEAHSERYYTNY